MFSLKDIVKKDHFTLDDLCTKLNSRKNFAYSRFGDGEFNAIWGIKGANCDGHEYFPDMGRELGEILASNPSYEIGLHLAPRIEDRTTQWLVQAGITPKNRTYNWSGIFHAALKEGRMNEFFFSLIGREVAIIGPPHVQKIKEYIDYTYLITVSPVNCWKDTDLILGEIDEIIRNDQVLLFCASMAANVWIHRLWELYGNTITLIDLGSGIDPYCGVYQRSFHRNAVL